MHRRSTVEEAGSSLKSFKIISFLVLLAVVLLVFGGCGSGERSKVPAASGGAKQAATSEGGASGKTLSVRPGTVGEKVSVPGGSFTRVSPERLKTMLKGDNLTLINTHVPFQGNIPGTDLSIPYNEIGQNTKLLPSDKDARIVLYCLGGPMSYSAATTLVKLGYTNVSDLKGGMVAWREAGLPLKGA